MENLVFTQLSIPEVRQLFRDELQNYFAENKLPIAQKDTDEIGRGAEYASKIIGKAVPTVYDLCHKRLLPHSKKGKDLYFSRSELLQWVKAGKRKTQSEIALEAENFSSNKSKNK